MVCRVCKEEKPLTEYYKSHTYKSGYVSLCKMCFNVQTQLNSKKRQEKRKKECIKNAQSNIVQYPLGLPGFSRVNYDKLCICNDMISKISEIDLSYLAGLFDGEGCVNMGKKTNKGSYKIRVCIYNSNNEVMEWLQSIIPGLLYKSKSKTKSKDIWQWTLGDYKAELFLTAIIPYIRIRKKQAQIALDCLSKKKKGYSDLSEQFFDLKTLNAKGR